MFLIKHSGVLNGQMNEAKKGAGTEADKGGPFLFNDSKLPVCSCGR
jgi:hypothetical protein